MDWFVRRSPSLEQRLNTKILLQEIDDDNNRIGNNPANNRIRVLNSNFLEKQSLSLSCFRASLEF